jgi:hypothetical protein
MLISDEATTIIAGEQITVPETGCVAVCLFLIARLQAAVVYLRVVVEIFAEFSPKGNHITQFEKNIGSICPVPDTVVYSSLN